MGEEAGVTVDLGDFFYVGGLEESLGEGGRVYSEDAVTR